MGNFITVRTVKPVHMEQGRKDESEKKVEQLQYSYSMDSERVRVGKAETWGERKDESEKKVEQLQYSYSTDSERVRMGKAETREERKDESETKVEQLQYREEATQKRNIDTLIHNRRRGSLLFLFFKF